LKKRHCPIPAVFFPFLLALLWGFSGVANADDGALNGENGPPKIVVFVYSLEIDTTFLGVAAPGNRSVENQLENRLIEEGFEVIDASQFERRKEVERLLAENDFPSANRLFFDFGADILVYGNVRRSFAGNRLIMGRPTRFFSNELRLKAVSAHTGQVLFSGYETKPPSGEGATLLLEEAASALCRQLIPAIEKATLKSRQGSNPYEVHISGIPFDLVPPFVRALNEIEGVENAELQVFKSGQAKIGLKYDGSAAKLAEALTRMKGTSLEIFSVQPRSIGVRLHQQPTSADSRIQ
jgi:hypothetical protein